MPCFMSAPTSPIVDYLPMTMHIPWFCWLQLCICLRPSVFVVEQWGSLSSLCFVEEWSLSLLHLVEQTVVVGFCRRAVGLPFFGLLRRGVVVFVFVSPRRAARSGWAQDCSRLCNSLIGVSCWGCRGVSLEPELFASCVVRRARLALGLGLRSATLHVSLCRTILGNSSSNFALLGGAWSHIERTGQHASHDDVVTSPRQYSSLALPASRRADRLREPDGKTQFF